MGYVHMHVIQVAVSLPRIMPSSVGRGGNRTVVKALPYFDIAHIDNHSLVYIRQRWITTV